MDTSTDDKQRLAETLSKLTPEQTQMFNRRLLLWQANGEQMSDKVHLEVARTIGKGLPVQEMNEEIKDHERRDERRQQEGALRETRQPDAPKTLDEIFAKAEKEVTGDRQRAAELGLIRNPDQGRER